MRTENKTIAAYYFFLKEFILVCCQIFAILPNLFLFHFRLIIELEITEKCKLTRDIKRSHVMSRSSEWSCWKSWQLCCGTVGKTGNNVISIFRISCYRHSLNILHLYSFNPASCRGSIIPTYPGPPFNEKTVLIKVRFISFTLISELRPTCLE